MIVLDKLLTGGVKFVLKRLADTVEGELNDEMHDEGRLKERLLNAQLRLELGELSEEEFVATEEDVLARLRAIQLRKREGAGGIRMGEPGARVTGVEVSVDVDE